MTAREAGDVVARSLVTAASQALVEQTEIEAVERWQESCRIRADKVIE